MRSQCSLVRFDLICQAGAIRPGQFGKLADRLQALRSSLAASHDLKLMACRQVARDVGVNLALLGLACLDLALQLLLSCWRRGQKEPGDYSDSQDRPRLESCIHALPLCSRSGRTDAHGKLIAMPRQRVSEQTLDRLRQMAMAEGIPLNEYVRVVLDAQAFGVEHVESLALDRIRRVVGMRPTTGPRQ